MCVCVCVCACVCVHVYVRERERERERETGSEIRVEFPGNKEGRREDDKMSGWGGRLFPF